jgi:hypothetical protein
MKTELTDTELLNWVQENKADVAYSRLSEAWYVDFWDHGIFKSTSLKPSARAAIIDAYNNIGDED